MAGRILRGPPPRCGPRGRSPAGRPRPGCPSRTSRRSREDEDDAWDDDEEDEETPGQLGLDQIDLSELNPFEDEHPGLLDLSLQAETAPLDEDLVAELEVALLLLPLRVRLEALVAAASLVDDWADPARRPREMPGASPPQARLRSPEAAAAAHSHETLADQHALFHAGAYRDTRLRDRTSAPTWRTVDVDGAAMRVMEAGTGDPLLFLHGWGLSPRTYAAGVTRPTAAGVRVIAPCLPGFGGSDGPPLRHVDMLAYGTRVGRLLDVLGIERPVFVAGHSFRGGVAIQLCDRPTRAGALAHADQLDRRRTRTAGGSGRRVGGCAGLLALSPS